MTNTKISKLLSFALRHGAKDLGLEMGNDGFVKLEQLLKNQKFKSVTEQEIIQIVLDCPKQRFALEKRNDALYIRANQGHSIKLDVEMELILDSSEIPTVVHGTSKRAWQQIETLGLSIMNRQHVHFASGLLSDPNVKSGMRKNCDVYIYINAKKAMLDGIQFFRSANGVILSSGKNGIIEVKYFQKVVDKNGDFLRNS